MQITETKTTGTAGAAWQPKIIAFCCNWCSYSGADLAGTNRLSYPAEVKIIRVPCSCRVNPMFILRAFQRGADGVILCGCHPGDCHYSTGNYHTRRRMTMLFSMLNYLGVESARTRVEWVSAAEGARFVSVMEDFVGNITALGPNRRLADLRVKQDFAAEAEALQAVVDAEPADTAADVAVDSAAEDAAAEGRA